MHSTKRYKWIGTLTGIAAALLIALNISISKYAFFLYLTSAITWAIAAYRMQDRPLYYLQVTFVMVNMVAIWRWFF
ncbi:hypothetical protein Mmc1_1927 [Magnetococcus marinus MC-1]|uniref:Nicotinamide riboside transporter PnuC n=1 Tax=Magnetococcus marinus (strain ATCC BAA-1437 / JCM 17883 / MC-1) TaxID=156889 RepID=A0L8Z2_MAGMM|nr:hypothetical protein [Magnetococcus marinus]ABK44435.1 hypothetical protein Mmc1_1927 [Magnetococcus marinus MC-1]